MSNVKKIIIALTVLSLISTRLFMGYALNWKAVDVAIFGVIFLLFSSLPFAILLYLINEVYKRKFSKSAQIAICITALLIDILFVLICVDILFVSTSSTAVVGLFTLPIVASLLIPMAYYIIKGFIKLLF